VQKFDTQVPSSALIVAGTLIIIGSASYMASTLTLKMELDKLPAAD